MTAEPAGGEMPEMFTDEWVAWLDSALAGCRADDAADVVLEYQVTDDGDAAYCWHVRIASGRISAAPGRAGDMGGQSCVTLTSARETARAIALEGASAQRAFAEGRLDLDGDPRLLLAARPALTALGAALAATA